MNLKCGIYYIKNILNNHLYIGQSSNIIKRWGYEKSFLRRNIFENSYIQNAWNKYGEENFEFKIIEECPIEELDNKEIYYIKKLKSKRPNGYNLSDGGNGNFGMKHSESFKKEHSKRMQGINNPMFGKKRKNSSSKYFGVRKRIRNQGKKIVYETRIRINKKLIELGTFQDEMDVAKSYNIYIIKNNLPHPLNIIKRKK